LQSKRPIGMGKAPFTENEQVPIVKRILKWILPVLAFALSALLGEWKGDKWEKQIRYGFYDVFLDSFPNYAPNFLDHRGIPVTYYPIQQGITAGYQYNGTIVANYAIDYYKQLQQKHDSLLRFSFFNCIHWLDSAISEVNGHALYLFDWQQPWYLQVGRPFTCGMTSGRAIEAFTYAFALDGDSNHLKQAARLVRGYALPVKDGGFTYKEPEGWWYEEIADTGRQTPRILDGHIFALTGLNHYYRQTHDSLALQYFVAGEKVLKAVLPRYDRGDGFVYYDALSKLADENYHPLLVKQMDELWQITGDPVYKHYYEKWGKPLWEPYIVRIWKQGNKSGWMLFICLSFFIWLMGAVFIMLFQKGKRSMSQ